MKKKTRNLLLAFSFLAVVTFLIFNSSSGWIFVKFNGTLYVASSTGSEDYPVTEKIGTIQNRTFSFLKPFTNNSSNAFPSGTELYSTQYDSEYDYELIVKYKNEYYSVTNTEKTKNWGDSIKLKMKDGKITP